MSEEQEQKNDGICLQAYSSKYTKVFQAAILHSCEGQKISKIEKHKCKRGTKIINLNKIIQHETVLLNCSRRVYQRIIKWKYKARQYLLLFPCRRVMCLYKTETNISNYCKIKLTTDIETNPCSTSLYIDTRYFTECVL